MKQHLNYKRFFLLFALALCTTGQSMGSTERSYSGGFRSLFKDSNPIVLLYELAAIYAASDVFMGRAYTYSRDPSLSQIATCFGTGYIAMAITTLFHEFGHAAAGWYLEGRTPYIKFGGNEELTKTYLRCALPHGPLAVTGFNPCRGYTLMATYPGDLKPRNWRHLAVKMAGGIAGIAAAFALKVGTYVWNNRTQFNDMPLETLKEACKHSCSLDSITISNLYNMFWPFTKNNDGEYWRTFFAGRKGHLRS